MKINLAPDKIELGGKKMDLTVLFSDVRGFTTISEKLDPRALSDLLNSYLTPMTELVFANKGTLDKYMGDAIMAVFPRPVGAVRAMRAAQHAVAGKPLALKVGIHTGPCIAINQNGVLDYFGSTVNLAARLEALSTGDDLIVSDAVLDDPEVAELELAREPLEATLKGFEDEGVVGLWRVRA